MRAISTDWNDGIPAYTQWLQDMAKQLYDTWSTEMSYNKDDRSLLGASRCQKDSALSTLFANF
ncbi:Protein of unknown function [Pyronema omphalodes CBS 100304]|uniref:Uncharacterized protein n=1 Tax=Pyronema omphalodes (strain CBS 100304) TaxID=1076935 RepID=U4LAH3_PYROM|nr:Protein of unknown function [Pyronema omphalodes CBS 100304]